MSEARRFVVGRNASNEYALLRTEPVEPKASPGSLSYDFGQNASDLERPLSKPAVVEAALTNMPISRMPTFGPKI